ncbi:superoxide dismutase [Cu-Zn]-like isoform X1 [Ceratina calcarata]|uniref:Superoxide dismutase [Cu-Zn] n=1 Tax=Ceratina calcarata TaxID=156304 RepID=A0AAJ7JEM2_9HYME|nr:superoxide dismutase [Cu-Zn]-like isoform X1 [Ceratina calcarata]
MNRMIVLFLALVVAVLAEQKTARVQLTPHNAQTRNVTGELNLVQDADNSILITGRIRGLTEGLHGFHVHEKGDLKDGCTSTGPHFNPRKVHHGAPHDSVRHVGDLGNIRANDQGEATVHIRDNVISFSGENNIVGRAFVVHSGVDDLGKGNSTLSSTTGNAGDRWACGIIELV